MKKTVAAGELDAPYQVVFGDVSKIVDAARDSATRSVNAAMTAAYWLIGHRIVEFEQSGEERARYGTALMERLAADLTQRFGRGFSRQNIQYMRLFYVSYPSDQIRQALSGKLARSPRRRIRPTPSGESDATSLELRLGELLAAFPLPWSAYVRLLSVKNTSAREFYGAEALRGGWWIRQLDRQINSQFYERTALSKNKAAMLTEGQNPRHEDRLLPVEEIKDPFVLEFLDLKDEYSESDLEEALIRHLETFLLELGGDFCFMGRQRRLRIGDKWYRVDLLFFHRRLRCHTSAVHGFIAALARQARSRSREIVQLDPPRRAPATSDTQTGSTPSTPTPSASSGGATPSGPSSWSGSAGPSAPSRWRRGWPPTCATTRPTAPLTTTERGPTCWSSSTPTSPRPTSRASPARRWRGPGSRSPCWSPTGSWWSGRGRWDAPGSGRASPNRPTPSGAAETRTPRGEPQP